MQFKLIFWPVFVRAAVCHTGRKSHHLASGHSPLLQSCSLSYILICSYIIFYIIFLVIWDRIQEDEWAKRNKIQIWWIRAQMVCKRTNSFRTNEYTREHAHRIQQQRMQYRSSANFSVTNVARLLSSISLYRFFFFVSIRNYFQKLLLRQQDAKFIYFFVCVCVCFKTVQ